jgi:hypothetical protein
MERFGQPAKICPALDDGIRAKKDFKYALAHMARFEKACANFEVGVLGPASWWAILGSNQ